MKKAFAIAIVLLCILTAVILGAGSVYGMIGDDGYAVPASSNIAQALAGDRGDPVALVEVKYEDTVYKKLAGYFVGEDRTKIDISYPLYVNGGVGIRFLDEANFLVTPQADVYQTFEGLYVSEGVSYNIDMSRADAEEFILLALDGGLYMNVQGAVFTNRLGSVSVPSNSILSLTEDAFSFYAYNNGTLGYHREDAVFDATITIGGHTYDYLDLLDALGLIRSAMAEDPTHPDQDKLQDAEELLAPGNPKEEGQPDSGDNSTDQADAPGSDTAGTGDDSQTGGTQAGNNGGNTDATEPEGGDGDGQGDVGGKEDPTEPESKPGDSENRPGTPGGSDGTGDPGGDQGETDNTPGGGDQTPGGGLDTPGAPGTDPGPEAPGTDTPGQTGGDGTGDIPGGDTGDHEGSAGDHEGDQGDQDPGDTGSGDGEGDDSGELAPAVLRLLARKYYNDTPATGSGYTFSLRNEAGDLLQTAQNDGNTVVFQEITLTQAGTYTFFMQEEPGQEAGTVYDDTVYTVTVTVAPVGGALVAETAYFADGVAHEGTPFFRNYAKDFQPQPDQPGAGGEGGGTGHPGQVPEETAPDQPGATLPTQPGTPGQPDPDASEQPGEEIDTPVQPGTPEGDGGASDTAYEDPQVIVRDLHPWCYAVDMTMDVNDPSSTIIRGVKFAVYNKLKGNGGPTTDEYGNTVYSQEDHEASGLMLRKTCSGSQTTSLNPLKPGQTVYIQYSYRFHQEYQAADPSTGELLFDEEGHPVMLTTRRQYYSDFIQVELPTVEQSDVKAVAVDWELLFAAYADSLGMKDLTVANTSSYDAELASRVYDFENFKLNTLPYVARLELKLTPKDGGEPVNLAVGSSVLTRAQKNPMTYQSANPKLPSNTGYDCTVRLLDRYGNELPMIANGVEAASYTHPVYTQKKQPAVEIIETENITDSLTLTLKVSDPDGALTPGQDLRFLMTTSDGSPVPLYGQWDEDAISPGGEEVRELALYEPEDGAEYVLKLESLAFSRLFTAQVYGDYQPQPDGADIGQLPEVNNAQFGSLQVYTASLSSGLVAFTTSFSGIRDTEATLNVAMNASTTVDILPLVDQFRVKLHDPAGKAVSTTVLDYQTLNTPEGYPYENYGITLEQGNDIEPNVRLYGGQEQYRDTPWDSFCIGYDLTPGDPENPEDTGDKTAYTSPMQLQIKLPTGKLTHFTRYNMTVEAVVIKGGEEYFIPVSITNAQFTTKKTIPVIQFDDLFIASDVAQFVNAKILDPDGTVLNGGVVSMQLYYGNTLLSVHKLNADQSQDGSGGVEDIRFDGLIEGGQYTVKFVASAYNDEEGYGAYRTNHVLWSKNIVGGSDLTGTLNLVGLSKLREEGNNLAKNAVVQEKWWTYSTNHYKSTPWNTYVIPCEPNTTYVLHYDFEYAAYWTTLSEEVEWGVDNRALPRVSNGGISQTLQSKSIATGANAHYIAFCIQDKESVGWSGVYITKEETVATPQGTYYANVDVKVSDEKGYLAREGESGTVKLTIEQSDSFREPSYTLYREEELTLEKGESGGLSLSMAYLLENLPAGKGWRATLTATYQGRPIQLDQIQFQTDRDYVSVSTHKELYDVLANNPYQNVLVTADFPMTHRSNMTVRGVVDFQGHVVSKDTSQSFTNNLINTVEEGAVVRNLVFDYPHELAYENLAPVFYTIRGRVENVIVRTYGTVYMAQANRNLLAYIVDPRGELENFIIRLGGDVSHTGMQDSYVGVVTCYLRGEVSNGYVYGVDGSGLLCPSHAGYGSMLGHIGYGGRVDHVYFVADAWIRPGSRSSYMAGTMLDVTSLANVYGVGDFYSIGMDGRKTYLLPLTTAPIIYSSNFNTWEIDWNVWSLTSREVDTGGVNRADMEKLYDIAWQKQTLGEGFDVENCVSMGFYPRLKLPTEMQKYQEYLAMPVLEDEALPTIISDGWGNEAVYGPPKARTGYISLRMKNDTMAKILTVSIENLKTEVVSQQETDDGLYEVILRAEVDPEAENFVSHYQVTGITFTNGTVVRSIQTDYETQDISFWKEIANTEDWRQINAHMRWNYRLVSDLDFQGVAPGYIVINGSLDNFTSNSTFYGKIDGQEHVLRNISLQNINKPTVIYRVYDGGQVKNVLVENMTIVASPKTSVEYCGFIGQASFAQVENIRVRNSYVAGGRQVGTIVGNLSNTRLVNCSAVDTTVADVDCGMSVQAGGLVGNGGGLRGCYTRNVTVSVTESAAIECVGGLVGYQNNTQMIDCYAHGVVESSGSYAGGLIGKKTNGDSSYLLRCAAFVTVRQISGDYAGGLGGDVRYVRNCIALGDVTSGGTHVNRIAGDIAANGATTVYAWEGQRAGTIQPGDKGDAKLLLTTEEINRPSVWQDTVNLGGNYDYTPVEQGCMPILKPEFDCATADWQQQLIRLPGSSDAPTLQVIAARYDPDAASGLPFLFSARLDHPAMTGEAVKELYESKKLTITLEGMDLSDAAVEDGRAVIEIQYGEKETIFSIATKDFSKATDSYPFIVRCAQEGNAWELEAPVTYLERDGSLHINWWRVSNIDEWNMAAKNHGDSNENVLLTGLVDFGGGTTPHIGLKFNRVYGSGENAGFANLNFNGGAVGTPWMEKIATQFGGLFMKNMRFSFNGVTEHRNRTGAILFAGSIQDLAVEDLLITCSEYSRGYLALISSTTGDTDNVSIKNVTVRDMSTKTNKKNYAGGLLGYTNANLTNVTAENVSVLMPYTNYVAGIAGSQQDYGKNVDNLFATGLNIQGSSYVGGLVGYSSSNPKHASAIGTAELGTVKGVNAVGGCMGWAGNSNIDYATVQNLSIKADGPNNKGYDAGGVMGQKSVCRIYGALVKNCNIEGKGTVGGVCAGQSNANYVTLRDVTVVDCTVKNNAVVDETTTVLNVNTGGVLSGAYADAANTFNGVVVRNTTVSGPIYVGGLVGVIEKSAANDKIEKVYIAEDVTVIGTGSNAAHIGGVVGWSNWFGIKDSICGATVISNGTCAGGILGTYEPQVDNSLRLYLERTMFIGQVQAARNYAGGLVGQISTSTVDTTQENLNNCLVSANIQCSGADVSFWANDTADTGSAGKGLVYVNEASLLHGQTAKALHEGAEAMGQKSGIIPENTQGIQTLVAAADFNTQTLYQDTLGLGAGWDYSHLGTEGNVFMPYTLNYPGDGIPQYANANTAGEADGILVPTADDVLIGTQVYPSGVNTVNIETGVPHSSVLVNGTPVDTDSNGVATLYYDFNSSFTVGDVPYTPAALNRRVMTYGITWYYIGADGLVHYGSAQGRPEQMEEIGTVPGVTNARHLWQGKVLTDTGAYSLAGAVATLEWELGENLTPTYTQPVHQHSGVQVYHGFSQVEGSTLPYQLYELEGTVYTVSPAQRAVTDGVILSRAGSSNTSSRYFATLGQDGKLTAYLANLLLGEAVNENISHISNNYNYSGTLLLLCYRDGSIKAVDYSNGATILRVTPEEGTFLDYVEEGIADIFRPVSGTVVEGDSQYVEGEQVQEEYRDFTQIQNKNPVISGVTGTDTLLPSQEGTAGEGPAAGEEIPGTAGTAPAGDEGLTGEDAQGQVSGVPAGAADPAGTVDPDGTGGTEQKPGTDGGTGTDGQPTQGIGGQSGVGMTPGGELTGGGSGQNGGSGGGEGIPGIQSGTADRPAQGGKEEAPGSTGGSLDASVAQGDGTNTVSGNGGQSGGTGGSTPEGGSAAPADGTASTETGTAVRKLLGASLMVYSPETGGYVAMDTGSLLSGEPQTASGTMRRAKELSELGAEAEEPVPEKGLTIAAGIGRDLYDQEKQGFLLIGIATLAGIALLVTLYTKVFRKKRR